MKKIFLIFVMILGLALMPIEVDAKNKVTVYIFRGYSCPHCEEALEYINDHKDEIDENIDFVTYEVWKNDKNSKLQDAVAEKLNVDTESDNYGIPFIVIGDKYIIGYGGTSTYNEIISTAESYIDSDDYQDVVREVVKELSIAVEETTLSDIFPEPNKVVTIVVYSIFGIAVVGFIGLITFSRKK